MSVEKVKEYLDPEQKETLDKAAEEVSRVVEAFKALSSLSQAMKLMSSIKLEPTPIVKKLENFFPTLLGALSTAKAAAHAELEVRKELQELALSLASELKEVRGAASATERQRHLVKGLRLVAGESACSMLSLLMIEKGITQATDLIQSFQVILEGHVQMRLSCIIDFLNGISQAGKDNGPFFSPLEIQVIIPDRIGFDTDTGAFDHDGHTR